MRQTVPATIRVIRVKGPEKSVTKYLVDFDKKLLNLYGKIQNFYLFWFFQ